MKGKGVEMIQTISGKKITEEKITQVAEQAVRTILSELPEEVQTGDAVLYVLEEAKRVVNGAKIKLQ